MARLWTSGFELQSVTNGVEWTTFSGSPTIDTSTFRNGAASLLCNNTSAVIKYAEIIFTASATIYFRAYVKLTTSVNTAAQIIDLNDSSADYVNAGVSLNTDDTLQLFYINTSSVFTQVGNKSSSIKDGNWHRVEIYGLWNSTTSMTLSLVVDGTTVQSNITETTGAVAAATWGYADLNLGDLANSAGCTGKINFDDVAINNNSGSYQNSFPGAGNVIRLTPNAAGDSNGFLVQVGGTAGSTNNFTRVDEITPDNASTYNASVVLNAVDLFACNASGIGASDTVNVVQVGGRFANIIADATSAFKFEIEKTTGGTKSQSAAIIPNSTTWRTNARTSPYTYPITLYKDPDNSVAWTQSTLDTLQVGYTITTANVNTIAISTVWVTVDYTPSTNPNSNVSDSTTGSEVVTVQLSPQPVVSDSTTNNNTVTVITKTYLGPIVDSTTNNNTVTVITKTYLGPIVDSTTGNEVITINLTGANPTPAVSDSTSDTDVATVSLSLFNTIVSDSSTGAEVVTLNLTAQASVADSSTGSEVVTVAFANALSVSDSSTGTEVVTLSETSGTANASVADSTTGAEVVTLYESLFNASVTDSTTATEAVSLTTKTYLAVADSTTGNEVVTVSPSLGAYNISVGDSTTGNEVVTVLEPKVFPVVSDTTTATEAVNFTGKIYRSISDSTTATESVSPVEFFCIGVSDITVGVDVTNSICYLPSAFWVKTPGENTPYTGPSTETTVYTKTNPIPTVYTKPAANPTVYTKVTTNIPTWTKH